MSEQRLQRSGSFALLGHPFVLGMKLCYLKWPSSTASAMDMPFSVTLQHCLMVRIDGRKNLSEPLLVLNVPQPIPRRSLSAGWTKRGRHYSEGAWATSTSKRRHVVVSCQEFFMKFVVPFKASQLDFQMLFDKGVCSQQRPWNARYHRNMVGLMPTWEHMLHNRLLEDYESQLNVTWLFDLSLICVEQHRKAQMSNVFLRLRIGWSILSGKLGKLRSRNSMALDSSFISSYVNRGWIIFWVQAGHA